MSAQRQQRGPAWLDGYVTAEEKLKAFRTDHPGARILTQRLDGEPLTFRAEIYLESNETAIPNATGHASVDGGSGNRKQSPTEKTETAALSRALTVMGYGGEEEDAQQRAGGQTVTAQIMEKLDILGRDTPWLNEKVRTKYGLAPVASWTQLADAHKSEVLSWLTQLAEKRVAEARG